MRKVFVWGALCLLLACALISCDMQGLVGEVLGEQETQAQNLGNMHSMQIVGTDENGNYIVKGENGTFVMEGSGIYNGDGYEIVIGGNGNPNFSVTITDPYAEIDAYKASDFVDTQGKPTEYVKITVRDYGEIVVHLHSGTAPITVANFKKLVEEGFYNGMVFHRVIQGFMIQGGGFDESGAQKSADSIQGEFSANGVSNPLKHVRGVISMARTSVPDSASSQFFICDADSAHLDGSYAAFGYVVAGMEVVDRIAAVATDGSDKPLEGVVIESIIFVHKSK